MAEGQVALYLIFTQVHLPPKEVKRKVLQQKKKKKTWPGILQQDFSVGQLKLTPVTPPSV